MLTLLWALIVGGLENLVPDPMVPPGAMMTEVRHSMEDRLSERRAGLHRIARADDVREHS
jgi:hypothetical protein